MGKKFIAVIVAAVAMFSVFTACGKKDTADAYKDGAISVAAMNGPTMMGLGKLDADIKAEGDGAKYKIKKEITPDAVIAGLANRTYDAACIPCNNAAVIFNNDSINFDIQVAAINTLNVLYLVQKAGTATINSLSDLSGKKVYMPGQGATPEYSFRYLLNKNNITDVEIEFVSDGGTIAAGLKMAESQYNYAVLPQPAATVAVSGAGAAVTSLNLTDEWKKIDGNANTDVVTGVLVVRTDYLKNNKATFDEFLRKYKASVDFMTDTANLETAAGYIVDMGIVGAAGIAKNALPKCGISYIDGAEMKTMVAHFVEVLYNQNSLSVGGKLPNDSFYYAG